MPPRPDLNGSRVKSPVHPATFLVDRGLRRHIPNANTYNNLFRSWGGIIVDINIDTIDLGTTIWDGAILARPFGADPVFLIDGGFKRHITSPAVMDRYHFSWERVYNLPPVVFRSIPTGPAIF